MNAPKIEITDGERVIGSFSLNEEMVKALRAGKILGIKIGGLDSGNLAICDVRQMP
jgi:hypothetical protein